MARRLLLGEPAPGDEGSSAPAVFTVFDITATLIWAFSGALLGARRGCDVMGVVIVAMVSATGGGLLRDGLFIQGGPPVLVRKPIYLELIALAALAVIVFGGRLKTIRWFPTLVSIIDGLGLGAYAVVGMKAATAAGLPVTGVIFVGMVNAMAGRVLRDLLLGDAPQLLRPGLRFGAVALMGCLLYVTLTGAGFEARTAACIVIAAVFVGRALTVRFDIRSTSLAAFEEDWRERPG